MDFSFLKENNSKRKITLPVRGKAIKLPIYFPSISSVKTGKTTPFIYFKILQALSPYFLVSAYDIYNSKNKKEFIRELKSNIKEDGAIIILDSGNYEKYWLKEREWNIDMLNLIVKENICDLVFCFDKLSPPVDKIKNVTWIKKSMAKTQNVTSRSSIIPIIHVNEKDKFEETILELYNKNNFTMVAIPERELGEGILERVNTITKIRKALNDIGTYIYIHILGTGNPLTLLLFSFAGADTFDGLEWCQTVVSPNTSLLYHFHQRELVYDECEFCKNTELGYSVSTFGHNLKFYDLWMKKIQIAIESNNEEELLKEYFKTSFISQLKKIWI